MSWTGYTKIRARRHNKKSKTVLKISLTAKIQAEQILRIFTVALKKYILVRSTDNSVKSTI
jgi:hypothetical protein